jgi:hypothetical protein
MVVVVVAVVVVVVVVGFKGVVVLDVEVDVIAVIAVVGVPTSVLTAGQFSVTLLTGKQLKFYLNTWVKQVFCFKCTKVYILLSISILKNFIADSTE